MGFYAETAEISVTPFSPATSASRSIIFSFAANCLPDAFPLETITVSWTGQERQ